MKTIKTVIKISLPVNQETCEILRNFYFQRKDLENDLLKDRINCDKFDNKLDDLYKETLSKLEAQVTKDIKH